MTAVAVSFQGTRVNASDANTDWGNLNASGPAPSAEPQNRYQGSNIVNKQITSSTFGGIDYDPGAGAVDMTAATGPLWFVKAVVADFADLVVAAGARISVGSANNAFYHYIVAGTNANRGRFDEYPPQGGFLIFGLNPNIAAWREGTGSGSPSLTAVDYFGFEAAFQNGNSKAENVGLDAIDIGTGLLLVSGDGADPDGTYADFVESDQNTSTNRYGVVTQAAGAGSPITCNGRLDIGSATATVFTSADEVVVYPDGYHGPGDLGVLVDLQNATSVFSDASTHIGLGSSTTSDTRPDFVVSGTSGTATITGVLTNFRNVTLTSAVDVDGATVGCSLLTQSSAEIQNAKILTDSASAVACLQDPTFGTTTGLHDTEFEQAGSGHAIELDTATTYNLTGLRFTGYGADTTNNAAIFVSATSGTVTINIGGDNTNTPTYRSAGATVVINNTKTVRVTVLDADDQTAISGARVLLEAASGGDLAVGTDILSGTTNGSGVIEDAGFAYTNPQPVTGRVRYASPPGPYYKTGKITGTISDTGFDVTVLLILDQ